MLPQLYTLLRFCQRFTGQNIKMVVAYSKVLRHFLGENEKNPRYLLLGKCNVWPSLLMSCINDRNIFLHAKRYVRGK